ncbi:MAG: homocysteine S-methyltransferase family protein [Pseudomonadota bacterium]
MSDVTLLDGGMGQELVRRSDFPATPLWSTQALIDQPGLVAEVHAEYAACGATVATSNTYALHRDRLRGGETNHYAAEGLTLPDLEAKFEQLLDSAMGEAQSVRDCCRIAGSIGPLAASYRPDLHPSHDIAVPLYAEVAKRIAPTADVLLFETVASVASAKAALEAGRQTELPVWLSFTVDDEDGGFLRSGEPMQDAVYIAKDADAVLVNCSAPEAVPRALDALSGVACPLGAYANGFEMITKDFIAGGTTADGLRARRDMGPETYAQHALTWLDHGATIVGGCCEVGPAHISELHRQLITAGHRVV